MAVIEDGAGKGFTARVNSDNRLYTFADSVPAGTIACADSRMWAISTGDIEYTTDGKSAALYFTYSGTQKLILSRFNFTVGTSTGGSGVTELEIVQNPTQGTIVSDQVAASVANRNFAGTSGSLNGTQYKGGEGKTITNGTVLGEFNITDTGLQIFDLSDTPLVLQNGNSIGFNVTPPTGNTSQTNRVFIIAYELVVV